MAQERQSEKAAMLRQLARALSDAAEERSLDFVDLNLDGVIETKHNGYSKRFAFYRNGGYIVVRGTMTSGDSTSEPVTQFDSTTQIAACEWQSMSRR